MIISKYPPFNLAISRRGVATRRPTIDLFYNESSSDFVRKEIPDIKNGSVNFM